MNFWMIFQCMDKKTEKRKSSIATPSKTSKLHEITPLKLHALQYHMYHQVPKKNKGFLGKSCSMVQKVENFCQEMPSFNFMLQMTVSCSEIKWKFYSSSKFFKSQRFKCKYSWTPQSIFSTPNPFWIFYHTNHWNDFAWSFKEYLLVHKSGKYQLQVLEHSEDDEKRTHTVL